MPLIIIIIIKTLFYSQQGVPEEFLGDIVSTVAVLERQIEVVVVAQFLVALVSR